MIELNKFMKYQIDAKATYKIITIYILKNEFSDKEYSEMVEFVRNFLDNIQMNYKVIIDFTYFTNISSNDFKNILYYYKEKYKNIIDKNINVIIVIIPQMIIRNSAKAYLYFNKFDVPVKVVEKIDDRCNSD
jgi:hypothetical protein